MICLVDNRRYIQKIIGVLFIYVPLSIDNICFIQSIIDASFSR